jgi:hypothetical protein
MSADVVARMILMASADPVMQSIFGAPFSEFRWFDRQLPPERLQDGTCARLTSVSQVTNYLHGGRPRNPLTYEWIQIDILDVNAAAAGAAAAAVDTWMETANLMSNAVLASPAGAPSTAANFKLNQRGGSFPGTEPPIPVETLDYRIYNVQP